MKKIVLYSLVLFLIQSCTITKYSDLNEEKYNCSNDITFWKNYEDTIQIKFVGIDSSIFKGKDYKMIADSLFWEGMGMGKYGRRDIINKNTGYTYRIIFNNKDYNNKTVPYDTLLYFEMY